MTTQPLIDNKTQIVREMLIEMENWPHAALQNRIKQNLRKMFQGYHALKTSQRGRLEQLIAQHRDICLNNSNDLYKRQHDTFVLLFVAALPIREVAKIQILDVRTVNRDINAVLDRMLVIMLGFYGIRWDK